MDNTPPPPGILPISTQQPYPPMNPSAQNQPSTRPSATVATPHNPSLAPDQDVPGLDSRLPNANSPPPYSSPPLFRHRGSYDGPHVSLPHTQPPHMVYSSSPFVFHHHPGAPGREASMSHMAYASPSTMSMLRPVYSYQGASADPTSSPHQTYGAGTAASTLPVYLSHRDGPSHSLAPAQASTSSAGEVQHPISYSSPVTYSPLRYTTRPPFFYPPTSFLPAPSMYGSHYHRQHTQSYGGPPGQENQEVWWYHPSSATAATRSFEEPGFGLQFNPSPVPQNEDEQSQTRTATPHHPSQTPFLSRGGPSDPRTETIPSFFPAPLMSSPQTRTTKTPPLTECRSDWPQERRSYHPKLPAHRSEWVMWVGNVPSDVTPDELRVFFNQPPESLSQSRQSPDLRQVYGGVSSVFLIARSNCAFVNFESEAQLEAAIARFHGKPIRLDNLPCPRLVCRVRKRTDDLKAGVGVQRGNSMHVNWIKEQRESTKLEGAYSGGLSSSLSTLDDDGQGRSSSPCSSRPCSPASTDSGILSRYFPRRYFILKSLTQVLFNSFGIDVNVDILIESARSERSDKCLGDTATQRGNFGSSISHQRGCVSRI
jgi:hypothetical protein